MIDRIVELLRPRPMVVVTFAFILGILIEHRLHLGTEVILLLILIGSLCFTVFPGIRRWGSLLLLILMAGSLRFAVKDMQPNSAFSHFVAVKDTVYQVSAVVSVIGKTRRETPKYTLTPFMIDKMGISEGSMILYAKDLVSIPGIGDTLVAPMTLNQPRERRNPHDFDYKNYLAKQGIFYEGFIQNVDRVEIRHLNTFNLEQIMMSLRVQIKQYFHKYMTQRSAGILSALILGERSEVDVETKADFANTGVIHVLAVSGLHVGYVSLILITITGMLRLSYRPQMILVIIGLGFYVILTGGAASVMRASIMAALILIATMLERNTDVFNILATAALFILLIDPSQISGIGFQLSFSAVFSIVTLFPILRKWIPVVNFPRLPVLGSSINTIVDLFFVSLAAQLGTLALTIYYFHKIPLISLAANLIVVPLIGLIVATGISFLLLGPINPLLSESWAALLDGVIDFMLWFVQLCARFEWAYISTRSIHLVEIILIITALFAITIIQRWKLAKLWLILLLLWGNFQIWPDIIHSGQLEVIMLDVGQGDAIIIHTPNGKTIVIDTGARFGGKDMGRDVISPFLTQRNWSRIDLLVLTHPHNDHIGGAQYLLTHHPVERVLNQNIEYDSYGYQKLQATLDSLKIPTQSVYTGIIDSTLAPIYLRVTGPKYFAAEEEPSNVNNVSIVLQLFYGETSLLLTGDAEHEVEMDQLPLGSLLKSDLIKAPHHGSRTSSTDSYLALVDPNVCFISLGRGNKYKHPAPITIKRYQDRDVMIHRTDLDGAVVYTSDGKSWRHQQWK